jgi:hypothetical protein
MHMGNHFLSCLFSEGADLIWGVEQPPSPSQQRQPCALVLAATCASQKPAPRCMSSANRPSCPGHLMVCRHARRQLQALERPRHRPRV